MRIGIFGSADDAHCQALGAALERRGAAPVLVAGSDLHEGEDFAFDGATFHYRGQSFDDVGAWQVRRILSPLPPAFTLADEVFLYDDWLRDYMHRRERYGYLLSWLHTLAARGVPLVNPPEQGIGVQLKTYQLAMAKELALTVPQTLVTNNPDRVRAFRDAVGAVVFKPSMGGDLCRPLDEASMKQLHLLESHPVIFQEQVKGTSVRVTLVGGKVVSSVEIRTAALDYRQDPNYVNGGQSYVAAPLPEAVSQQTLELCQRLGLSLAGVDFIRSADGTLTFLEANSSPSYLDIEEKTRAPISDALAQHLLAVANRRALGEPRPRRERKSFIRYASPFDPVPTP